MTLSADEGEALIARVHQSNLGADDAGVVEWVIRLYFWVALTFGSAYDRNSSGNLSITVLIEGP